jgi:hypothetical protein
MLQVFYLDVAYVVLAVHVCCKYMFQIFYFVSNVCCKYFIWILYLLQKYVVNVLLISDVCCNKCFYVASVS